MGDEHPRSFVIVRRNDALVSDVSHCVLYSIFLQRDKFLIDGYDHYLPLYHPLQPYKVGRSFRRCSFLLTAFWIPHVYIHLFYYWLYVQKVSLIWVTIILEPVLINSIIS